MGCPKILKLFTRHNWKEEWYASSFDRFRLPSGYIAKRVCQGCGKTQIYYQSPAAAGWETVSQEQTKKENP